MTPAETRRAQCPYCLEILTVDQVTSIDRFPKHRGHGRLRCAGWGLPVQVHDCVAEEEQAS